MQESRFQKQRKRKNPLIRWLIGGVIAAAIIGGITAILITRYRRK